MSHKRLLPITLLILGVVTLSFSGGAAIAQQTDPQRGVGTQVAVDTAFTYQGYLEESGRPANGEYDFEFNIHNQESGGSVVFGPWNLEDETVSDGYFTVPIDVLAPDAVFDGGERWLEVGVRPGDGIGSYTYLMPRQPLRPTPYAFSLWPGAKITGENGDADGVLNVWNTAVGGFRQTAIYGQSEATYGIGVYGKAKERFGAGVFGESESQDGTDVVGINFSGGTAGAFTGDKSGFATNIDAHVFTIKNVGYPSPDVLALQASRVDNPNIGINYVTFFDENSAIAAIEGNGSGGVTYKTSGADFAEMLPAQEDVEPTDVLVIDADGRLARSTESYQLTVVGVHSSAPGFIGGGTTEEDEPSNGDVPLAVVGVVPVKVSAENGAIQPGDLLVTSDIPGHAMAAGADPPQGTVIGKALEGLENGTGVIRILVILQ